MFFMSPLGTRGSFFMDHPNEIVHIPTYFPYRGILVCSLDQLSLKTDAESGYKRKFRYLS